MYFHMQRAQKYFHIGIWKLTSYDIINLIFSKSSPDVTLIDPQEKLDYSENILKEIVELLLSFNVLGNLGISLVSVIIFPQFQIEIQKEILQAIKVGKCREQELSSWKFIIRTTVDDIFGLLMTIIFPPPGFSFCTPEIENNQ